MPGITSPTIRPARAPITGARMASPGSATTSSGCAFAVALWNGKDPILKERLFGLTNSEGNHGEDVKEYYFYLDSTPTHSYMKYLYKYPQNAYPYGDLVETNRRRGRNDMEYELLDTGIFDDNRYFDVFVEYAKAGPSDILIQISVMQPRAGDGRACTCCRPCGFAIPGLGGRSSRNPPASGCREKHGRRSKREHAETRRAYLLHCDGNPPLLFTENETNNERIFGTPNATPYVKDGINDYVVAGRQRRRQPEPDRNQSRRALPRSMSGAGETAVIRLRLSDAGSSMSRLMRNFDRSSSAAGARPTSSIGRSRRPASAKMRPM